MKQNIGIIDRIIRVLFAISIFVLFLTDVISGTLGIILLVIAGSLVLTSFFRFCPLYIPFRINTIRKSKE